MSSSISVVSSTVDEQLVQDFIELFGPAEQKFSIIIKEEEPPSYTLRGSMIVTHAVERTNSSQLRPPLFNITIWTRNIERHTARAIPVGGNSTRANGITHGIMLVLAHELRHCQQYIKYGGGKKNAFYTGKYAAKTSEQDARRFVDENYEAISDFVGVDPLEPAGDQIETLVNRLIEDSGGVQIDNDAVWEAAFSIPGDAERNFSDLMDGLKRAGCPAA